MKEAFPEYFVAEPDRQEILWANCMFVLDTNVLLDLYRFSDDAREALFKVIESLGERLWIPYQVAAEFFDNRLNVIEAQSEAYAKSIAGLKLAKEKFNSGSRHPFVSEEVFSKFIASYDLMIKELEGKQKLYVELVSNDLIKEKVGVLLNGKVGEPYSEDQISELAVEGEHRYSEGIPPGFEDGGKMPEATTSKMRLKKFGDLILWKQLIDKATASSKSVILVTGEKKDDWWLKSNKRLVSALPALSKEFMSEVKQDFLLYSTDRFLVKANEYLEQSTSDVVVEEVRAINKADAERNEDLDSSLVDQALLDQALNRRWPNFVNDSVRFANSRAHYSIDDDLYRASAMHTLDAQRDLLLRTGNGLREQIDKLKNEHEYHRDYQKIFLSNGGSLRDLEYIESYDKMRTLGFQIEAYEKEYLTMRNQWQEVFAHRRKSLDED